jgi:hypothetical protein
MIKAQILLVEDQAQTADLICDVLKAEGYDVQAVDTLAKARARLQKAPPELMILDRSLPDGDGADLLEGEAGHDILKGHDGSDTLVGGTGDDWLVGGHGTDVLNGGTGSNHQYQGDNNSRAIRDAAARIIDWTVRAGRNDQGGAMPPHWNPGLVEFLHRADGRRGVMIARSPGFIPCQGGRERSDAAVRVRCARVGRRGRRAAHAPRE